MLRFNKSQQKIDRSTAATAAAATLKEFYYCTLPIVTDFAFFFARYGTYVDHSIAPNEDAYVLRRIEKGNRSISERNKKTRVVYIPCEQNRFGENKSSVLQPT